MDDTELLQRYANSRCGDVFAQLVRRHIDFVYASALRLTRDPPPGRGCHAECVHRPGARRAKCSSGAVLPAWLHSTARNISANILAIRARRRLHEQRAAAMKPVAQEDTDTLQVDDDALSAALDDALGRLATSDRAAVVLRYLLGKSVRDVAAAMRITPEAAQKRVSRAVDRLRDYFAAPRTDARRIGNDRRPLPADPAARADSPRIDRRDEITFFHERRRGGLGGALVYLGRARQDRGGYWNSNHRAGGERGGG